MSEEIIPHETSSRRSVIKAMTAGAVGMTVGFSGTVAAQDCGDGAVNCWPTSDDENSGNDKLKKSQSMDLVYYGKAGEYEGSETNLAIHEFQLSALSSLRHRYTTSGDWQRTNERGKRIGSAGFRINGGSNVEAIDAAETSAPLTVGPAYEGEEQSSSTVKNGVRIAETLVSQNPVVGAVLDTVNVIDALHDIITDFSNNAAGYKKYWDGGDFPISPDISHQVHFVVTVPVTNNQFSLDVHNMCELEGQTSGQYNSSKELTSMSHTFKNDGSGTV